jgi:hypothetical protein
MATLAVLLHYGHSLLFDFYYLWLCPHRKYGSMPQTVFCFEEISSKNVILGHMAVVTGRNLTVRTMLPGGILRSHYVAIDARFWVVGQVRMGIRHIKQVGTNTTEDSQQGSNIETPESGRFQKIEYLKHFKEAW